MKRFICIMKFQVLILVIILFSNCSSDIISHKNWKTVLFDNSQCYHFEKKCYKDIIGLSTDGSVFDFYQYHVQGLKQVDTTLEYPLFTTMFDTSKMSNIKYSYWKNTPINEAEKDSTELVFIAKNSSLHEYSCSEKFLERDFLLKKGCYYSYFGAYPVGSYLFVFSPDDNTLFILVKK